MADTDPIRLTRRGARTAAGLIGRCQAAGLIDADTADRLRRSATVRAFDWHGLSRIAIVTAAACFAIAVASAQTHSDESAEWVRCALETIGSVQRPRIP